MSYSNSRHPTPDIPPTPFLLKLPISISHQPYCKYFQETVATQLSSPETTLFPTPNRPHSHIGHLPTLLLTLLSCPCTFIRQFFKQTRKSLKKNVHVSKGRRIIKTYFSLFICRHKDRLRAVEIKNYYFQILIKI